MAHELSPQSEQYLAQIVAGGVYPSTDAALEAAIAALREKTESLPLVPEEHMEAVEQAAGSSRDGRSRPLTAADWSRLQQQARDVAARNRPDGA